MVDATIAGFYTANAPLSYIGTVLVAIILGVLAFFGITILRSGSGGDYDEWDDDYDDEDDTPARKSSPPSAGPSSGPSSVLVRVQVRAKFRS